MDTKTSDTIDPTLSATVPVPPAPLGESESAPVPVPPIPPETTDRERDGKEKASASGDDMQVDAAPFKRSRSAPLSLMSPRRDRQRLERKLHYLTLPPHIQKHVVSLVWPRGSSEVKYIKETSKHRGKRTPDDYAWGETQHDFFQVTVAASHNPHETAVMTSSQLLRTMREFGELRTAKYEIEWAKLEGDPKVQNVVSTQALIEAYEKKVSQSRSEFSSYSAAPTLEDGVDVAVSSPFHPSHYPAPWPFIPFKHAETQVLLQERIPLYLLPQILYVHDPFNLLSAVQTTASDHEWTSKPDVIQTYTLNLRENTLSEIESERKKAEELEELKSHTSIILRYAQTEEQVQDHEPVIEVVLPPYPQRLTKIDQGHLFLSPAGNVGSGNHSVVYNAEWELPRDLFVRPKICNPCLLESIEKEIERLKTTGEWDRILREWKEEGSASLSRTIAKMREVINKPIDDKAGKDLEREIICVVSPIVLPTDILGVIDAGGAWNDLMRHKEKKSVVLQLAAGKEVNPTESRSPPIIRINPTVSYRNRSHPHAPCSHDLASPVPRTTKFAVIAKLSLKGDEHLEAEAQKYQEFPDYFFEHWSGYTFLRRLDRIVPLNAIVPQFYGYYAKKDGGLQGASADSSGAGYLSPILLLEHCGESIETTSLSLEEQEECASLFVRFHHAGWLHQSVYGRNVLVQNRRPTESESGGNRWALRERSFRLIDFGRSKEFRDKSERETEDRVMRRLFTSLPDRASKRGRFMYHRGSPDGWYWVPLPDYPASS